MEESSPGDVWRPNIGLPNVRVFQCQVNCKRPPEGFVGAHHNALPIDEALLVPGPQASYGFALDDFKKKRCQFLLVDCDSTSEQALAAFNALPATWEQRTWSGKRHKIYLIDPDLFATVHNKIWRLDGVRIGDIKVHGYAMGPGATVNDGRYERTNDLAPVPAPDWLVTFCSTADVTPLFPSNSQIPHLERDYIMQKVGSLLRRYNLDEGGIFHAFNAIRTSPAMEQPEGFPWTEADAKRVAHSCAKYETLQDPGRLIVDGWTSFSEIQLTRPPFDWWVHGFIPVGELLMLYGSKAKGKSTFMAWVAAQVTKQGGRFGFVGIEEPPWRFGLRAAMMGADRELMINCDDATRIKLPRDADKIREAIEVQKLHFLYFDSIYEHFESERNTNAAQQARHALSPLAIFAQLRGCTILGTLHENKKGEHLGSTEVENVGRGMLRIYRRRPSPDLYVAIRSNFGDDDEMLHFKGRKVELQDPLTGEYQMQRMEDGSLKHREDWLLDKQPNAKKKGELDEEPIEEVNLGEIKEPKAKKKYVKDPKYAAN